MHTRTQIHTHTCARCVETYRVVLEHVHKRKDGACKIGKLPKDWCPMCKTRHRPAVYQHTRVHTNMHKHTQKGENAVCMRAELCQSSEHEQCSRAKRLLATSRAAVQSLFAHDPSLAPLYSLLPPRTVAKPAAVFGCELDKFLGCARMRDGFPAR